MTMEEVLLNRVKRLKRRMPYAEVNRLFQEEKDSIRTFKGPCPDCCNGTICTFDAGDLEHSIFVTCPKCKGDSRQ